MRGYFGIGIYNGKTIHNIGTLWRSAYQLGASFIFTINQRWEDFHCRWDDCKLSITKKMRLDEIRFLISLLPKREQRYYKEYMK